MKKLLLLLCLLAQIGFSQSNRIDSLKMVLSNLTKQPNGYPKDTLRCQVLKALMRAYSDKNIDSSFHYNSLMIRLCGDPKLKRELSFAYQYAGYLYQVRGDYYQSVKFYLKTLSLAKKMKQYSRIVRAHGGLAHAYTSLKEYPSAKEHCERGLEVLRKYPDATIQLSILNVLGALYREQGKLANALKINQDMHELAQLEHKAWFESQGLHAIGWDYMEMGDMTKALDYYERALILARKIGSIDLEGSILLHITNVYIQQKKWSKALMYCNQAKQTAMRVKNSGIVMEAEANFYKIYRQTDKIAKALKAHESFALLKDSLSKEKTQQRIETLKDQHLTEELEQKVELLNQRSRNQQLAQESIELVQSRNELIRGIVAILLIAALLFWNNRRLQAKNRILIQLNKEIKEALFKGQTIERKRVALELHDNLSSLLSAVNMSVQSINPQNLSESEQSIYRTVKQLIQNAYAEVRNISHNILPPGLEREGLATTLTTYIGQLNQSSSLKFSLTITGLQERLPVEIELNVYSIVFELINNAIKHANAKTIDISLLRTDLGINVSVTDDGIGLAKTHDKRGVGLQNIQTRLDSLGGTFNTVMPVEKGTRILIKIPIESVSFNGNFYKYHIKR